MWLGQGEVGLRGWLSSSAWGMGSWDQKKSENRAVSASEWRGSSVGIMGPTRAGKARLSGVVAAIEQHRGIGVLG